MAMILSAASPDPYAGIEAQYKMMDNMFQVEDAGISKRSGEGF